MLPYIKLGKKSRDFVLLMKKQFQSKGSLSRDNLSKLRKLKSRYSVQVRQLEESRERARHTNGRRSRGLTIDEVERSQAEKKQLEIENLNDYGF